MQDTQNPPLRSGTGYPKKGEIRDKAQDYQMNVSAWKWSVGLIYPIANWGSRMVCFNEKVELLMQSHFYLQFRNAIGDQLLRGRN